MSAFPSKPGFPHSPSDWNSSNRQLSVTAQQERHACRLLRQEIRSVRDHTACQTSWDEGDTCRRLSNRLWDVSRWKETLEACAQKVDEEMESLTLCKARSEQDLAGTGLLLEVSLECLSLREGRRGPERVADPVEEQLKKEVELIDRVQQVLQQQHIDRALALLCVLQEARHQLTADLQNKMETLDIDMSCLSLTLESPQISLKTNPTRIPPSSSTTQEWVQFSQNNVARAQEVMRASQRMREDINLSRAQLQNELETQRRTTEFAHRKRHHHEEQAFNELLWQIKQTEEEMEDMDSDISRLDADLQAKTAALKLAHTRLETRTCRPGVDLCRDEVQHGLVMEVAQLEACTAVLKQKLSDSQLSLQKLKLHHARMGQDLSRKQEAMSLEQRSMETRTRLPSTARPDNTPVPLVPLMNFSGRKDLQLLTQ